jgi:2-polyprenyl-3-methyl-5-hydroxy-6-metoxy-1,4-benzoquinol methylase
MQKKLQQDLYEIVKKNYAEIADDFIETRKKQIWPPLFKLTEMVKEGDSVLDAGCGNGRLLQAFKMKKVRYIGLDFNQRFIEYAKSSWAIPNGKFVQGDILDIDKNSELNEEFDFIFCVAVIHNIPDFTNRALAILQLKKKLKPEGRLVISVWNLWSRWKYLKLILEFLGLKIIGKNSMDFGDILFNWGGKIKSKRYYHAFTANELGELASVAGLMIEKKFKDKYNYYLVLKR